MKSRRLLDLQIQKYTKTASIGYVGWRNHGMVLQISRTLGFEKSRQRKLLLKKDRVPVERSDVVAPAPQNFIRQIVIYDGKTDPRLSYKAQHGLESEEKDSEEDAILQNFLAGEEEEKVEWRPRDDNHLDFMLRAADEFDKFIKYDDDSRKNDELMSDARLSEFVSTYKTSEGWTSSVNAMKCARLLKERLICSLAIAQRMARSRKKEESTAGKEMIEEIQSDLDILDDLEIKSCSNLYGAFRFLSGMDEEPTSQLFDKKLCDAEVERKFGSLDREGEGLEVEEARVLFSNYLSRKIWVPTAWRKLLVATNDFIDRVARNPIREPVNQTALAIAKRILELLLYGSDSDEAEYHFAREYVPDASCAESSRSEGGKRMFLLLNKDPHFKMKEVKPASILTGGKIRTITTDSAYNCKYIWINKYLGACFRKLRCSVFGGDVSDWFKKIGGLACKKGEKFVSGDLESATDLFDGRITDELIDLFCERMSDYDLTRRDANQIKAFTTRALLKVGEARIKQNRGQLMGSVVSFPFLCILSLTAYFFTKPQKWLHKFLWDTDATSYELLMNERRVGINGDDVVFPADEMRKEMWLEGVVAIGGKTSRGKTLVNDTYFTVNSELWTCKGKVNCLRPSLLTALTGDNRYFISPQREWKEFRLCTLQSREAECIWNLTEKLNLDLPPSYGGLGLVNKFDGDRMFEAFLRKKFQEANRLPIVGSAGYVYRTTERKEALNALGDYYPVFVDRSYVKAFRRVYRDDDGGWQISPREARMFMTMLLRPDLFPDSQEVLSPFKQKLMNFRFHSMDEIRRKFESTKDHIVHVLRQEYPVQMRGLKKIDLPVGLHTAYFAVRSPAIQLEIDQKPQEGKIIGYNSKGEYGRNGLSLLRKMVDLKPSCSDLPIKDCLGNLREEAVQVPWLSSGGGIGYKKPFGGVREERGEFSGTVFRPESKFGLAFPR